MQKDSTKEIIQMSNLTTEDLRNEIKRREDVEKINARLIPERIAEIGKLHSSGHVTGITRFPSKTGKMVFIVSTDIVE